MTAEGSDGFVLRRRARGGLRQRRHALPSLRLLVVHDDADREFEYTAGAEEALQRAKERNWTVISIKDDWEKVFVDE
jgi:hypothetical protein